MNSRAAARKNMKSTKRPLSVRRQDENNIVRISLVESVCGILVTDNAVGAQTERSGAAGPVSAWLGGATSPATSFHLQRLGSVRSIGAVEGVCVLVWSC